MGTSRVSPDRWRGQVSAKLADIGCAHRQALIVLEAIEAEVQAERDRCMALAIGAGMPGLAEAIRTGARARGGDHAKGD